MSEKWVRKDREDGTAIYWMPYEQYIANQFFSSVFDITFWGEKFWGIERTKERIWKVAQREYEKFKTELPASYLAHYLPDANT